MLKLAETNCKTCSQKKKVFQEIFGINVAPLVVNVHSHTKRGSSNWADLHQTQN